MKGPGAAGTSLQLGPSVALTLDPHRVGPEKRDLHTRVLFRVDHTTFLLHPQLAGISAGVLEHTACLDAGRILQPPDCQCHSVVELKQMEAQRSRRKHSKPAGTEVWQRPDERLSGSRRLNQS